MSVSGVTAPPEVQARLLELQALDDELGRIAAHRRRLQQGGDLAAATAEQTALRRRAADERGALEDLRTRLQPPRVGRRPRGAAADPGPRAVELDLVGEGCAGPRAGDRVAHPAAQHARGRRAGADGGASRRPRWPRRRPAPRSRRPRSACAPCRPTGTTRWRGSRRTRSGCRASGRRSSPSCPRRSWRCTTGSARGTASALRCSRAGVSQGSNMALTGADLAEVRAAAPDAVVLDPESDCILVRTAESGLEPTGRRRPVRLTDRRRDRRSSCAACSRIRIRRPRMPVPPSFAQPGRGRR